MFSRTIQASLRCEYRLERWARIAHRPKQATKQAKMPASWPVIYNMSVMPLRRLILGLILILPGSAAYADGPITFNNQIVRIFQQHCQTCHRPGNIAPFSLLTYTDARPWARAIKDAVLLKTMPPWKPVNSHGVFSGERSLTDQEIQTISQWVDNGAEEGAAADLPEPFSFPETWSAGTPDVVLQ